MNENGMAIIHTGIILKTNNLQIKIMRRNFIKSNIIGDGHYDVCSEHQLQ